MSERKIILKVDNIKLFDFLTDVEVAKRELRARLPSMGIMDPENHQSDVQLWLGMALIATLLTGRPGFQDQVKLSAAGIEVEAA